MARTSKRAPSAGTSRSSKRTKGTKAAAKRAPSKASSKKAAAKKAAPTKRAAPRKAPKKPAKTGGPKKGAPARVRSETTSGKKPAGRKAPGKKVAKKATVTKASTEPTPTTPAATRRQPAKAAAPPPPPPKKPQKPEVTPKAIEKIKATLEEQRVALLREFSDLEEGSFSSSQSDMSGEASFDEEYADAGSYTFEREKELSIGNNIRDLLEKVEHALDRIERGRYGLCENCGDPINKDRLLALPYSSLCIRCKQREERTR